MNPNLGRQKAFELIIIGGGPAGMTAGVYAARKKIRALLITKELGGQPLKAPIIENYLGYQYISGYELVEKFKEHLKFFDLQIKNDEVIKVNPLKDGFKVETVSGRIFSAKALIVATGKSARQLGVPGEKEFRGKGVTHCATCDAPLFQGQAVAVAGGETKSLETALQLANYCPKVYLISPHPWVANEILKKKVKNEPKIFPLTGYQIIEIKGYQFVEEVKVKNLSTAEERSLPVKGVFVESGYKPNSNFVSHFVKLNQKGEIIVNCQGETNYPGLFAAGDVTNVPDKQIIIAAGEGAKAALNASSYLIAKK